MFNSAELSVRRITKGRQYRGGSAKSKQCRMENNRNNVYDGILLAWSGSVGSVITSKWSECIVSGRRRNFACFLFRYIFFFSLSSFNVFPSLFLTHIAFGHRRADFVFKTWKFSTAHHSFVVSLHDFAIIRCCCCCYADLRKICVLYCVRVGQWLCVFMYVGCVLVPAFHSQQITSALSLVSAVEVIINKMCYILRTPKTHKYRHCAVLYSSERRACVCVCTSLCTVLQELHPNYILFAVTLHRQPSSSRLRSVFEIEHRRNGKINA